MTARKPQQVSVQKTPTGPMIEDVKPEAPAELDPTDADALRARLLSAERAEGRRIAQAMTETRTSIAQKEAEHEARMDRWKIDRARAHQAYEVAPVPPTAPDTRQDHALLHHLQDQLTALADQEERVLGRSLPQVESGWHIARQEFAAQAVEHVEALEALLDQAHGWQRLLMGSRRADEQIKGSFVRNGDADRMPQSLELADILRLGRGVDILEPAPRPPSKVETIPRTEDRDEMRRVNLRVQQQERDAAKGVRRWL